MKRFLIIFSIGFFAQYIQAQDNVGIGTTTPHASAMLEINSLDKGVLFPRLTTAQRTSITGVNGLLVFDTNTKTFWFHNGSIWVNIISGVGDITGVNAGAGLTGGGISGSPTIAASADNGLNVDASADRIQLGGSLRENTLISQGAYSMTHNLNGTGSFTIQDNGLSKFTVFNNGRVSIGGNATAGDFNVTGRSHFSDDIYLNDGSVNGVALVRIFDSADDGIIDMYRAGSPRNRFHANGNSFINGGNLGLNTTAPTERLDVNGEVRIRTLPTGSVATDYLVTASATGELRRIGAASNLGDDDWGYNAGSGLTGNIYHNGKVGLNTFSNEMLGNLTVRDYNSSTNGTDGVFLDMVNDNGASSGSLTGIRFSHYPVSTINPSLAGGIFWRSTGLSFGRGDMVFATGATSTVDAVNDARMTITNGGDVIVNNSGDFGSGNGISTQASYPVHVSTSNKTYGVYSYNTNVSTNRAIYGYSRSAGSASAITKGYGVYGSSAPTGGLVEGYGAYGTSTASYNAYGVYGRGSSSASSAYGLYGYATGSSASIKYGVRAFATNATASARYGIYATISGVTGSSGYAGYFGGNVYSTGTFQTSHEKLKENVSDAKSALASLMKLRVKEYDFIQEGNKHWNLPTERQTGMMSGEMKLLYPSLVRTAIQPAPTKEEAEDMGIEISEDVEFEAVNYTGLVPHIIKGTQEQQQEIEALKKEVIELRQELKDFEAFKKRLASIEAKLADQ